MAEERMNIYKASRSIKRKDNSLYNALRSIYQDSIFVGEISQIWSQLPLLANLRCGLWYSPNFESTCYFKSTDGHNNNWSFNTSRLNLHVAHLAGQKGGCMIVDSTRKGKRFPDSMSKTIPIWTCVLNRAIVNYWKRLQCSCAGAESAESSANVPENGAKEGVLLDWDCSLHLPLWVSNTERASIEGRLEQWTEELEASGADIGSVASALQKPLRPLWVSQRTVIWLNEVPYIESWDFTPIILVNASSPNGVGQQRTSSEFSWHYIPGAGDDEESWARGLSPNLFWKHSYDLISSGPALCNAKVADIVEKDRVYRAHRGQSAPQINVNSKKLLVSNGHTEGTIEKSILSEDDFLGSEIVSNPSSIGDYPISWVGSTNIAVGTTQIGEGETPSINDNQQCVSKLHQVMGISNDISIMSSNPTDTHPFTHKRASNRHLSQVGKKAASLSSEFDCMLNCGTESVSGCHSGADAYLHLSILLSKFDRFSLVNNLPSAVDFAKLNLSKGKTLFVCCGTGEDISICVSLAILTCLFNDKGSYDGGKSFKETSITKWEMRKRLIFICKFATNARPSRGNLRQVFSFLNRDGMNSISQF